MNTINIILISLARPAQRLAGAAPDVHEALVA